MRNYFCLFFYYKNIKDLQKSNNFDHFIFIGLDDV